MLIIIAPDSFTGSLDAVGVARAIAAGVSDARADATIECVPMADGGEGTLEVLLAARHGQRREATATGPLGEARTAPIGLIDGASAAVIELAAIAGLTLVPESQRNPLITTSYGVGELIRAALDTGVERIVLALGGSATVDGGAGMMQALGLTLLDHSGRAMPHVVGGGRLSQIASFSTELLDARLGETPITVAADVLSPLCGPNGAAAVFAPQKGADAAAVAELTRGLEHWAGLLEGFAGREIRDEPGAGAAGGAAAPLLALADAQIVPGIDLVIEAVGLRDRLAGADLVITGEGRLDAQSMMGKVVSGVARLARAADVPCAAIVGDVGPGHQLFRDLISPIISLSALAGNPESALREPQRWLTTAARKLLENYAP